VAQRSDTKAGTAESGFTLKERIQLVEWRRIGDALWRSAHVLTFAIFALLLGWSLYHANQAGYLTDVLATVLVSIFMCILGFTAFLRLK
jgi:hypothetical protein